MKHRPRKIGWLLLVGTLLAAGWTSAAQATQPAKEEAQPKPAEKTVAFEMRQVPWPKVFEWLSDQTGMPVITNNLVVTDTFNFISPRLGKEPRKYAIPEVIDLINEGLLRQKFTLIRRTNSFLLVPADEKIDPVLLPRIDVKDLEQRGSTEIVIVELGLEKLVAEDFAPEVKKSLGPFGEVSYLSKANRLILQDSAGNLRRVLKSIKEIEESEKSLAETFSHKCVYIRASAAAATLKELLGDAKQLIEMTKPAAPAPGPPFGRPEPPRPTTTFTKVRMHYITADERTNTVHVNGPPDKIAQAKAIIKSLDVPQNGQRPIAVGPPILQTYPVPAGNAEAVVKTLQGIFKEASNLRISALSNNQIMVYAGPEDQIEIARHIQGVRAPAGATELLPLSILEPTRAVEILKGMFGDAKTGAPYIDVHTDQNALVVKGSVEQVAEVKAVLKAIDGNPAAQTGNMRIITLEKGKGSAATLAEALQRLLPQMRPDNPVRVILPGSIDIDPKQEEPRKKTGPPLNLQPKQEGPKKKLPDGFPVSFEAAEGQGQLADPKKEKKAEAPPAGKAGAPITITAFGNKLIVTSEDPQALALVQELVRLLTQTQAGEGDFEIIRLKNANAVEAAKVLDEAFNGPRTSTGPGRPSTGPGGPGGFSPFGGMSGMIQGMLGGAMGGTPRAERIRVVADTTTNSLLVKGSPLDLLTIRNLLAKALDSGETDSRAVIKTWMLGPLKFANATDVASVIREVFRESVNNNPVGGFGSGFSPFGMRPATQNVDAQGNPRGVMLSVGTDERTNSLVLACPQLLYEDIKKLVDQLEKAAADTTQVVKVISIKGVDPQLVQQALDAIQGRKSTTSTLGGSRFGTFGGSGYSPFGGSGFMPGGFSPFRGSFGPPGGGSGLSPFSPGSGGGTRGFRPPGSSRGPGNGPPSGGPDFFVDRVKDDPRPILFDPRHDFVTIPAEPVQGTAAVQPGKQNQLLALPGPIQQVSAAAQPPEPAKSDSDATAPRLPVTAEALSQLGIVILRANNAADLEAALRIVEFIQKQGAGAEVDIQIVPLKHADATSVTNILLQLYQRVQVGPNATTIAPPTTTGGGQPQAQQQQQPQGTDQGMITQQAQAATVVLIPLPRHNSIMLAVPRARTADILREIQRLDIPVAPEAKATPFPLKRAAAARVANLITSFYTDRFPRETRTQHQIRVTYDDSSNTVFVQAAPADLAEIKALVERIDSTVSSAVNDLRIIRLNNAVADELANILLRSIAEGVLTPSTGLGQQLGAPGQLGGGGQAGQGPLGALMGQAGQAGQLGQAGQTGAARQTKSTSLRFFAKRKDGISVLEAGILDDIRITPDARTNSLVLSAPEKTMQLILALVKELDVPPTARAEINIFTLKKADAGQVAALLQQLFMGTGGVGTGARTGTTGATGPGALPGLPGITGPGTLGGTQAGTTGTGRPPLQLTLGGTTPEGAPLIDLRVTIDERTNSLIVGGSRNDLQIIEVIISRLEDSDVQQRHNEAVRLKNAQAVDVASALNDFLTKSLNVLQKGNQLTAFQEIQRDVIIAAEPISNTLLVSATPAYFPDIMRLIGQLDALAPQVVIQVLVAEVDLNGSEELGFEFGVQSPVLFQRSVVPTGGLMGTGTVNFAEPAAGTGMVPPGVTVNSTINPAALPGFNFNNVALPLGNNPAVIPGLVGFQGLGSLGTGRISPNNNFGGLVISAASDSFNLLIRALKIQGRIDVLSRPQIMTLDNQTANINVGQEIPIVTSSNVTATGIVSTNIDRRNVGVLLSVTPKINCDGRVVMRVMPEISSVAGQVPLGNGLTSTSLNIQHLETTVSAYDGETVALGGLITKRDTITDNKIPCLGDLPLVGCLFRYRSQTHTKTELLIILTPHVVYSPTDVERILAEEKKRIDWVLADVNKVHGPLDNGPRLLPEAVPGLGPFVTPPMVPGGVGPNGALEQGPLPRPQMLPQPTSQRQSAVGDRPPAFGQNQSASGDRQVATASLVVDGAAGDGKSVPVRTWPGPTDPTTHCPLPTAHCPLPTTPTAVNQGRENRPWRLVP